MRVCLLLLAAWGLLAVSARAQNSAAPPPEQAEWLRELHDALSPLDAKRLGTGVLLDRIVPHSRPHAHDGSGAAVNTYDNWEQQYGEFYYASLDRSALPTPDEIHERVRQRLDQGQVPLLVLRYRYDELRPDAAAQQLIQIDSSKARVYDGPVLSASPYQQGELYAVALPLPNVPGPQQVSLYVGPEFCFGNVPPSGSLWLSAGNGWQPVALGSSITVSFNPPAGGAQAVQVYDDGRLASTSVQHRPSASVPPDAALGLVASRVWQSGMPAARGIGWIKWADGNTSGKFRRPMVFVEGIDFSFNRGKLQSIGGGPGGPITAYCPNYPVSQTGLISLGLLESSCPFGVGVGNFRNGDAGWNEMVDYNYEYPSLEQLPALRTQLQSTGGGGYDVIFLDFTDGATHIQQNAMVLVELLQYINDPAHRTPDAEETLVVGASMGGQVARFALAWLEQQQDVCHNAKLYVSVDSPHRGANVPLGCQYMINRLANTWVGGSAEPARDKLLRPASKQMIIFHYDDAAAMPLRNAWQAWQSSPGSYPDYLRRVAVANGSANATPQPNMTPGMELIRTNTINPFTGQALAYALPGTTFKGTSNVVFRYRVPFGTAWRLTTRPASIPHYDTAPGSTYATVREINHAGPGTFNMGASQTNAYMLPTSALDVFAAGPIGSVNVGYDVNSNIALRDLPDRTKYAFDAYFAQDVNQPHVQITNGQPSGYSNNPSFYDDNSAWIRNELRQSTHGLPAQLSGPYNFGSRYRHLLASVDVESGGHLHVNNGALPINGGVGPQGAAEEGVFQLYTSSCGSRVRVRAGGQLTLGQAGTAYAAALAVVKQSLLEVQSGGTLTINAGSELRVRAGATLVVRQGATVQNNGSIVLETGAYLCLEPSVSIQGQAPQLQPGVTAGANPALGLTGLACQSTPCAPAFVTLQRTPNGDVCIGSLVDITATLHNGAQIVDWHVTDGTETYRGAASLGVQVGAAAGTTNVTVDYIGAAGCPGGSASIGIGVVDNQNGQFCVTARVGQPAVYPNPADAYVDVRSPFPAGQPYRIEFYNDRGRLALGLTSQQATTRVDTRQFPAGIYHVRLRHGNQANDYNLSVQH